MNDVVIAIQKLTEKFDRILYIDLDIHHGIIYFNAFCMKNIKLTFLGNGVQNAFELSKKVVTASFHKHIPGFYPGTGDITDIGCMKGKYHSINIPFLDGISHSNFLKVFLQVFPR